MLFRSWRSRQHCCYTGRRSRHAMQDWRGSISRFSRDPSISISRGRAERPRARERPAGDRRRGSGGRRPRAHGGGRADRSGLSCPRLLLRDRPRRGPGPLRTALRHEPPLLRPGRGGQDGVADGAGRPGLARLFSRGRRADLGPARLEGRPLLRHGVARRPSAGSSPHPHPRAQPVSGPARLPRGRARLSRSPEAPGPRAHGGPGHEPGGSKRPTSPFATPPTR